MKFMFVNNVPSVLLMSLVLLANAQRSSNNLRDAADFQELARQNKITKQILEAFIQKKLGLPRGHVRAPSVREILPKNMVEEKKDRPPESEEQADEVQETQEYPEDDSLQSVESEQIDSIYAEGT